MSGSSLLLFVFAASLYSTQAQCSLSDLECCLSQFSGLISVSGIDLTERRAAGVCTTREQTEECFDLFLDHCVKNETDKNDVEGIVNKTVLFLREICPPTSSFMAELKANEECIANSSVSFQTCYNKTIVPRSTETNEERMKKDCCEYKELRNCAVQTVENKCGPTASQLVQEDVVHTNGAVLEWVCSDIFSQCGNSAMMLASSTLLALYCIVVLKFVL